MLSCEDNHACANSTQAHIVGDGEEPTVHAEVPHVLVRVERLGMREARGLYGSRGDLLSAVGSE